MTSLSEDRRDNEWSSNNPCVAVVGAGQCTDAVARMAEEVGRQIARLPADLVCGGLGGAMEAAARGAQMAGGRTIGILPGIQKTSANPHIEIIIPTGMGQARNVIVVLAADIVLAVGGEFGTLSEISLALKHGIPVIGLHTWPIADMGEEDDVPFFPATSPDEAIAIARRLLSKEHGPRHVKGGEMV